MITVGVITTHNPLEKLISIFIMLILAGIFGYSLNTIGIILQDYYKSNNELKRKLNDINHYMNIQNVNHNLKMKVRRYFQFQDQQNKEGLMNGIKILNEMPKNLKEEIYSEAFLKTFMKVKIFKQNFSKAFLNDLTIKVQELCLAPEEMICLVFILLINKFRNFSY